MRRRPMMALTVALLIFAAACGGDDADPTTTTATDSGTTTEETTIEETSAEATSPGHPLVIAAIDFDNGVVTIRNDGESDYDATGHFLCNRPTYIAVPDGVIPPGGTVDVAFSASADDGEMGLYTSRDFGNADAIVRYVQWGSDSHGRTATAVEAGVWTAGDSVSPGGNLMSTGSNPISAADWSS